MFKKHYSRFLSQLGNKLHFAAHSHHAWPDVSREAHLQCWDDSARLIDDKWEYIFSEVIPTAQKKIAELLNLKNEKQIAFAPNTHELLFRLLSTFELNTPIKILTTKNEFHSFRRQTQRMEEAGLVEITSVQADELIQDRNKLIKDLIHKLQNEHFDLFFISQVFFDSGLVLSEIEILELVQAAPAHTTICIDGYHAFAAIPVNLSKLEGRIFYLSGGYKYAQAGEGMCFMVVPQGEWRPVNTGWFAEMDSLSHSKSSKVNYAPDGAAFFGSTQDVSGFYRFNAVWKFFEKEGISIPQIHSHVEKLQDLFLAHLSTTTLAAYPLLNAEKGKRGHFLAFDLGTPENCAHYAKLLKEKGIITDHRGQRLRIGFGLYQNESDVMKLIAECNVVTAVNH